MHAIPDIDPRGDGFVVSLIAHDGKKDDMMEVAREHRSPLRRLRLLATGNDRGGWPMSSA
jgi:methylglyoxal synthase